MFHTRTSIESGAGTAAVVLPVGGEVGDGVHEDITSTRRRLAAERSIDEVLQDSFPASDPPSWNPGVVRPGPSVRQPVDRARTIDARTSVGAIDIVDVSRPHAERTFLDALISFAGAAAVGLIVPFVILVIGLPVVLAIRGLVEVIAWAFGISVR